eukprot:scaffold12892_cov121-Isochrysis_galbana.AAC.3
MPAAVKSSRTSVAGARSLVKSSSTRVSASVASVFLNLPRMRKDDGPRSAGSTRGAVRQPYCPWPHARPTFSPGSSRVKGGSGAAPCSATSHARFPAVAPLWAYPLHSQFRCLSLAKGALGSSSPTPPCQMAH